VIQNNWRLAAVTFLAVGIKTKLEIESRLETIKNTRMGFFMDKSAKP